MNNDTNTALNNLANFYNGNSYNVSTNAGGMANGGHRVNFISALNDVAVVGRAINGWTQAALAGGGLVASSSSSVAIGTGSKSFTIETGKAFVPSMPIVAVDLDDVANMMRGTVTSYNSGTGAFVMNTDSYIGSGTQNNWAIYTRTNPLSSISISYTAAVAESASTNPVHAALMDDTHAILVWVNTTPTPDVCEAIAVDFSDPNSLSFGSKVTIDNPAGLGPIVSVCALSATLALVAWIDTTNTAVEVRAVALSGTTLTPDTPLTVESIASASNPRLVTVSSTAALLVYRDLTNNQTNVVHIDATTPSALSAGTIITTSTGEATHSFTSLSATLFAFLTATKITFVTLSGATVTDDGDLTISGWTSSAGIVALDSEYVAFYNNQNDFPYLALAKYNGVGDYTLLGQTPLMGPYLSGQTFDAITKLDNLRVLVFGMSRQATGALMARVYERQGDIMIPIGEWAEIHQNGPGTLEDCSSTAITSDNKVLVAFEDGGNSSFVTAIVIEPAVAG